MSRRDVLKLGLLGSAALYLPVERVARGASASSLATLPRPFQLPFVKPAEIDLRAAANGGTPITSLQMTMRQRKLQVLGPASSWPATDVWTYVGPRDEINPTIHVDKGQPIEMTHVNALPSRHPKLGYESSTSVHLHGSASLPQYDGYASDVIRPGQRKVYKFPNMQAARTLWYHDHAHGRTAQNAYAGLAAQYHLHDEMEARSGIPTGAFESPLTIRDASFAADGSFLYDDNSQSSLMGDVILVNNVPWPKLSVQKRRYRFRVLNASISRPYQLSLSDPRAKMWVIATDGGFMPSPVQVSNLRVGMAERYEVIIDFTDCLDNAEVILRNASLPNTVDYANTNKVMMFKVGIGKATDLSRNEVPTQFYTPRVPRAEAGYIGPDEVMGLTASMASKVRSFRFERGNGMWTINGQTWNEVIASDYNKVLADPAMNSVEVWEFTNNSGGWSHPVHVHLVDFKVLSRTGRALQSYEKGPKDVVYVGEGETVRMVAKFGPHEGRYMIHCHNLVHEDHDMMAQFRVGPVKASDPNDPILAAPAY